jgi:hypothetical protein
LQSLLIRELSSCGFNELALYAARGGNEPPVAAGSAFPPRPQVSVEERARLSVALHRWEEAVEELLGDEPSLQEYAKDPSNDYNACALPPTSSTLANSLREIGNRALVCGQPDVAWRSLDAAGDDHGLVRMLIAQLVVTRSGGGKDGDAAAVREVATQLASKSEKSSPGVAAILRATLAATGSSSSSPLGWAGEYFSTDSSTSSASLVLDAGERRGAGVRPRDELLAIPKEENGGSAMRPWPVSGYLDHDQESMGGSAQQGPGGTPLDHASNHHTLPVDRVGTITRMSFALALYSANNVSRLYSSGRRSDEGTGAHTERG